MVTPNLDNTMGLLLVGVVLSTGLYGLNFLQCYTYFRKYNHDSLMLKLTVALVWALDTAGVALATRGLYRYVVTNYGNPAALGVLDVGLEIESYITIIITFIVQCFFANMILTARRTAPYLAYLIYFLAFAAFGLSLTMTSLDFVKQSFEGLDNNTLQIIVGFALGTAAVCDIMITISLYYTFHRGKSGFEAADQFIDKLIVIVINRGVATFIVQFLNTVLFIVYSTTLIWAPFHLCLAKVYTISFLATLNHRHVPRGNLNSTFGLESVQRNGETDSNSLAKSTDGPPSREAV